MSGNFNQFSAEDAFVYTDTYRNCLKQNAATIATEKERLRDEARRSGLRDSQYYAKFRGMEHAIAFLVDRIQPGFVVLGDGDIEDPKVKEAEMLAQMETLQGNLDQARLDNNKMRKEMKEFSVAHAQHQEELQNMAQKLGRAQRKLKQTSSSMAVIGITMFTVIVVLLLLLAR